ncbi:MAG TPA: hypothetical protein VIE36_00455 [Methylomirabilota bacterium]|jgi:hypothetical protein
MNEFPRAIRPGDGEATTRIICPECGGSITVRGIGDDVADLHRLVFQCRVGHRYAFEELLIGKERHIDRMIWGVVYAYEELAGMLRTATARDGRDSDTSPDDQYRRRAERAEEIAAALRALIHRDESIKLKAHIDGE